MTEPLVNDYQVWECGDQTVTLGIRHGIALFARCTCQKANLNEEIGLYEWGYKTWSWESSYCVHTYTVLAHFYARHAMKNLEAERLDK